MYTLYSTSYSKWRCRFLAIMAEAMFRNFLQKWAISDSSFSKLHTFPQQMYNFTVRIFFFFAIEWNSLFQFPLIGLPKVSTKTYGNQMELCTVHNIFFSSFSRGWKKTFCCNQGCGSGSGLDPDSEDFVDPDPYWESGSGSRGKKIKKFQWKKSTF
jgi:hypothetical protein